MRGFKVTELGIVGHTFKVSEGYTITETPTEWIVGWRQPFAKRTKSGHVTVESIDVAMLLPPAEVVFTVLGPVGGRP